VTNRMEEDIVVTGRGVVTAAGRGVTALMSAVSSGACLLRPSDVIVDRGVIPEPVGELPYDALKVQGDLRVVAMAKAAAIDALAEARLTPEQRSGPIDIVVGTGSGSRAANDWRLAGREPPPHTLADGCERFGVIADRVSSALCLTGRSITINTACSSGGNAVAHGWALLTTARSTHVVCIGVEELWAGLILAFKMMGALAEAPCAPFRDSRGTTLAEGAAAVVIERADIATQRGARCLGRIIGVGQSADGYHMTRPDPNGDGAEFAIRRALDVSNVTEDCIDAVSAHGTGTAANDKMERWLYDRLFPGRPIIATKGVHGHTHGASAVVELIILLEGLRDTTLTQTSIVEHSDAVPSKTATRRNVALKNVFAFGGLNTSIVVGSSQHDGRLTARHKRHSVVAVAEFAAVGSSWLENDPNDGDAWSSITAHNRARVAEMSSRTWRRLDLLTKMTYAAATHVADALSPSANFNNIGLSYATELGPLLSWTSASSALQEGRHLRADVIARLSYNAAPSTVCEAFSMRGPTVGYLATSSARSAFEHAVMTLELGLADAMIVVGADEYTGLSGADDGLLRFADIDVRAAVFDSLHASIARPRTVPGVAALLLVRDDRLSNYADDGCDKAVTVSEWSDDGLEERDEDVLQSVSGLLAITRSFRSYDNEFTQ
jgi:3-oxoacyl-(acyl-carrier-protein) synthase